MSSCKVCGKEAVFISLIKGYRITCSNKCAGVLKREELRNDKERYNKFVNKVKSNQKEIWKERKDTGSDKEIREKISHTIKKQNSFLTKDELIDKYGWMNKLEGEERKTAIKKVIKPLILFYSKSSEATKQKVYDKRIQTKLERCQIISLEQREGFDRYRTEVRSTSDKVYRRNISIIDPEGIRGKDYHLDHIISIQFGYLNNIDPDIISDINNLRIISAKENLKKRSDSAMELEVLLELISNG